MVTPFERGTLRNQIAHHIFEAIIHGELQPGEKIVESKLARAMHVSQSALREALQELEHQGLVIKHDNRFTYVTKPDLQEVEDIYDVRRQFEPMVAAAAHLKLTREQAVQLEGILEDMRIAGSHKDYAEVAKTDVAFHQLIWKISERRALIRALTDVITPLAAFFFMKRLAYAEMDKVYEDHRALLASLKEGGPEEVKKLFEEKLEVFRAQYLGAMQAPKAEQAVLTK